MSGSVPSAWAISDERWAQRPEEKARLDRAALAAHNAFFEPEEQLTGIELELWRNVARAVRKADRP